MEPGWSQINSHFMRDGVIKHHVFPEAIVGAYVGS